MRQQLGIFRQLAAVSPERLEEVVWENSILREIFKASGDLPKNWDIVKHLEMVGANTTVANDSNGPSESPEHLEFVDLAKGRLKIFRSALLSGDPGPTAIERAIKEERRLKCGVSMQEKAAINAIDMHNLEQRTVTLLGQIVADESIRLEKVAVAFAENRILTDLMRPQLVAA